MKWVRKCVESHGGRRRWEAMGIFGIFRDRLEGGDRVRGRVGPARGERDSRGYGKVGEVGGSEQNLTFFSPLAAI